VAYCTLHSIDFRRLTLHLHGVDIVAASTGNDALGSERSESGAGRQVVCRSTGNGKKDSGGGKLHRDVEYEGARIVALLLRTKERGSGIPCSSAGG
jgi:hypothetical protein